MKSLREEIAKALLNARGGRRGVPLITNVEMLVPDGIRDAALLDADAVLELVDLRKAPYETAWCELQAFVTRELEWEKAEPNGIESKAVRLALGRVLRKMDRFDPKLRG